MFVRMNFQMSAIIKARKTKFGMQVYMNLHLKNGSLHFGNHAHRPRFSLMQFFNSICKQHVKDTIFPFDMWLADCIIHNSYEL